MLSFLEISSISVVRLLTTKAQVIFRPQLPKKAPQRPGGSSHLGHLCQAAAFSPGLGKSPPSWLIALGPWTWGSLAGSQAVWVSLQGALWPEVEVSLLQGPVASEGVTRGHNDLV